MIAIAHITNASTRRSHVVKTDQSIVKKFTRGFPKGLTMPFIKILAALLLIFNLSLFAIGPMSFGGQNNKKPSLGSEDKKKTPKKNPFLNKPYPQLVQEKEKALKTNDIATALKILDAMRIVSTQDDQIQETLLEMGKLYEKQENWEKAEHAYHEFVLYFPSAPKTEFAARKEIECGCKLTSDPDRDQTKTQEVLKLTQNFIKQFPQSEQREEVQKYATICREKLYASDKSIFDFHMHRGNYKVAQKRLDIIVKDRIPELPTFAPQAYELAIQLAQAQNNTESLLRAQLDLGQKFPDHEITKRLVTDLPAVQTQLASIEKAKLMPLELPKAETVQLAQLVDGGSDLLAQGQSLGRTRDLKEQLKSKITTTDDQGKTKTETLHGVPTVLG